MKTSIWIGFDRRDALGFAVARRSAERRLCRPVPVRGLVLSDLEARGLYVRPTTWRDGNQLWDDISCAPMSTEFAISRFLVPHLVGEGLALFVDSDVMFRVNPVELFALHRRGKAVSVVKHDHKPTYSLKMCDQAQTVYPRKAWSSVVVWDLDHPSNKSLSVEMINTLPGRDLHAFCWLRDDEIGELPARCNYLVGHTALPTGEEPAVVHWTDGGPHLPGREYGEYADEFWREVREWAR